MSRLWCKLKHSKDFINAWVEESTERKMKNLFPNLDPRTVCVLVSCIYFKGDWLDKFDSSCTNKKDLYCAGNKTAAVNMMCQENWYQYYDVPRKLVPVYS